jgi:hypothetical protein
MRAATARDPAVQAFWHAVADFSRQPDRLVFETRLPRPLPLGRLLWLRSPEDVVRNLALEVRYLGALPEAGRDLVGPVHAGFL